MQDLRIGWHCEDPEDAQAQKADLQDGNEAVGSHTNNISPNPHAARLSSASNSEVMIIIP
jgi:hypothetical protein